MTQVVVPDPAGPAVYAATRKGLYRSDGQGGWEFVSESGGERGIVADPTNPDIVYRGDHPPCAVGGTPQTLRKSADGGRTWTALQGGKNVRPVIVDPSDASVIYGERCTLAISPDAGQTWNDVPVVPTFDVSDLALAGKTLYGIYTSEGGTSRLVATDVSTPTSPRPGEPLLTFWGGGAVAATADRLVVGEPHGVHVSPDGGKTWSFSRAGLEQVTISVDALKQPIPEAEQGRGFGIFAVAVDPRAPERIFAGTIRGLYASGDGGKTWSRVSGVNPVRVRALSFAEGGARLYVATDEGVVVLANP
ncbi:MAG: exo-alpha-sialidase [Thermomicrobiaceae bacterium]|nr:exo-alpha-sialidase [Thermomicrobiaceae bacterium]